MSGTDNKASAVSRIRKITKLAGRILLGLFLISVFTGVVLFYTVLPGCSPDDSGSSIFTHDKEMEISKKTDSGVEYTVNNSTAIFKLDVTDPDKHCELVFTNYLQALDYCKKHELQTFPSVQMIQGKLKSFDYSLCAALELVVSKRRIKALTRLYDALKTGGDRLAIEHVATALILAGETPDLEAEILDKVKSNCAGFLPTTEAKPCGFWDKNEQLRKIFQSDRFLMRGFNIREHPKTCIALSRAIVADDQLRSEFRTLSSFDAKLTNPLQTVSFELLAKIKPEEVKERFEPKTRFALVAYSTSKEQSILERLAGEGIATQDRNLMALIVHAIRSGRFNLDPQPGSGWYDYQWHALETLVAPDRGYEYEKLQLTEAYQKRLMEAFATVLTKQRETHLKHLPIITLGCMGGSDEPMPKVVIKPEFSAEPTLTVYLRFARGYHFLRNALTAVLGENSLKEIHILNKEQSVDEALEEMVFFCYGLYGQLSLESGLSPEYLPDELSAEELEQAKESFLRWQCSWQSDPAFREDARFVAPIAQWSRDHLRHWGTAGVRLEAVGYSYVETPEVSGRVDVEFSSLRAYLPTDIFVEFHQNSPEPLTREKFRSMCDSCRDIKSLHKTLGSISLKESGQGLGKIGHWLLSNWLVPLFVIIVLVCWRVPKLRWKLISLTLFCLIAWGSLLSLNPAYRTKFIVRHVAVRNDALGLLSENRLIPSVPVESRMKALSELLLDEDNQVRYLAARFISSGVWRGIEDESIWYRFNLRQRLMKTACDSDPEIAIFAIMNLGQYKDKEVADFLLYKLSAFSDNEMMSYFVVDALAEVGDLRAIKPIQELSENPDRFISLHAILALGKFKNHQALEALLELAESTNQHVRNCAVHSITKYFLQEKELGLTEEGCYEKRDDLFIEKIKDNSLPFNTGLSFAGVLKKEELLWESAYSLIDASSSSEETNRVLVCTAGYFYRKSLQHSRDGWDKLTSIITNSPARLELAHALHQKNSEESKQALTSILTEAATESEYKELSKSVLQEINPENESNRRGRRRRRPR